MKFYRQKPILFSICVFLISGCSSGPVYLGSTNFNANEINLHNSRNISAYSCGFTLLNFIPIATSGRLQRAYDRLIDQAAGDPIGGIKIQVSWRYIVIGTRYCTKMTAKAYPRQIEEVEEIDLNEL